MNPSSFLKPLAKLFSVVQNKLSRQTLCTVFQVFYITTTAQGETPSPQLNVEWTLPQQLFCSQCELDPTWPIPC